MTSKDEQVRATIAEQASEWFVANDEEPLGAQESAALVAWLKASPVHVEEFLGVAGLARDLHAAGADPEHSVETLLARARAEDDSAQPFRWRVFAAVRDVPVRRWQSAAIAVAAIGVVSLGFFVLWNLRPIAHVPAPAGVTALNLETRHGEQLSRRLADESVLHLDTDSAVTIRYGKTERLVQLTSGQAAFEVAHEPDRPFRVVAGPAEVVALGTKFNVRLEHDDATVVTVVEGQVVVAPSPNSKTLGTNADENHSPRSVQLSVDQQIRVAAGQWPATPATVDARRATSWLHRQILFEHEPLARVAAEFNRYAPKPIEITTPELRDLEISGVFATDDSEAFIAFLRSLEGVRVEVTATRILVSRT